MQNSGFRMQNETMGIAFGLLPPAAVIEGVKP
jgi:hypothetical protein